MSTPTAVRVESAIDAVAAAAFAAAIGFARARVGVPLDPLLIGAGAFALAYAALRSVKADPHRLPLARFEIAPIGDHLFELCEPREDLREERDDDALVLDDVLVQPDPGSRVVQLFDPARAPGELHNRIDRHVGANPALSDPPDASQALSEALRDLRRSLS